MKKYVCSFILFAIFSSCVCYANTDIQISDKDKKLYNLRKNTSYNGDLVYYNVTYTSKAESFLKKKNLEKSCKYINLALYYYDKNPLTYIVNAELEIEQNELQNAKVNYQKAIDILDSYIVISDNKQYIEYDTRLYDSYMSQTIGIRIKKGLIKIALKEGDIKLAKKELEQIRTHWEYFDYEVIELQSQIANALGDKELGNTLAKVAKSFANLDSNLRKRPNDSDIYYSKALLQFLLNEKGFALYNIDKAIALNPKSAYYLFKTSLINNNEDILECINEAVRLSPVNNAEVYEARANYYYDNENYEKALSDYKKAIQYGTNESEYFEQIGICYFELQDYNQALRYFSKSDEFLGYKANTLLELGRYQEALNIYTKILNDPMYNKEIILSNMRICKKKLKNK